MKPVIVLFVLLCATACFLVATLVPAASPRATSLGLAFLAAGLALEAAPL